MIFASRTVRVALAIGLGTMIAPTATKAGFVLTAEAAGVQSSQVSGVTTENFNATAANKYTTLNTAVGTVTSPGLSIVGANTYGGAGGGGRYAAIGAQSGTLSATLTLASAASYFGFWWSAADANNVIDFLSKGQVVASFSASSALAGLGNDYFKNPNDGSNSGEKYAYLNVYGTGGSTFDQVRLGNLTTGTGFETDNWSVLSAAVTAPYSGTTLNGAIISTVPEPSSLAMVAVGAIGLAGARYRRGSAAR